MFGVTLKFDGKANQILDVSVMPIDRQYYFCDPGHGLFELANARGVFSEICRQVPALIIDNFFAKPEQLQKAARELEFREAPGLYPGRQAHVPREDKSSDIFSYEILQLITETYLPVLNKHISPAIELTRAKMDFAVVDQLPEYLSDEQKVPHIDPVPLFGLVYLSDTSRGGTLFFEEQKSGVDPGPSTGYFVEGNERWKLTGKVDGLFNRAVFYPGSIHHTGEITGGWIATPERFSSPRLTMRMLFS